MGESKQTRQKKLSQWLDNLYQNHPIQLSLVAGDASFRRYYRIAHNNETHIVMDAPPSTESNDSFLEIASLLRNHHVAAPQIYHQNLVDGFFILEDFGDQLFAKGLQHDHESLYKQAIESICAMQKIPPPLNLVSYDMDFILMEIERFEVWFVGKLLGIKLTPKQKASLNMLYDLFLNVAKQQPYVFTHRDYHSRNLLIRPNTSLGVIDFQDAICGPLVYDLVSLLKDCYIKWPREYVVTLCQFYLDRAKAENSALREITLERFLFWFDMIGLQRHIKVLGIFSRLALRDNKPGYLNDIPRIIDYIEDTLQLYLEIQSFKPIFDLIFNQYRETLYAETLSS